MWRASQERGASPFSSLLHDLFTVLNGLQLNISAQFRLRSCFGFGREHAEQCSAEGVSVHQRHVASCPVHMYASSVVHVHVASVVACALCVMGTVSASGFRPNACLMLYFG